VQKGDYFMEILKIDAKKADTEEIVNKIREVIVCLPNENSMSDIVKYLEKYILNFDRKKYKRDIIETFSDFCDLGILRYRNGKIFNPRIAELEEIENQRKLEEENIRLKAEIEYLKESRKGLNLDEVVTDVSIQGGVLSDDSKIKVKRINKKTI